MCVIFFYVNSNPSKNGYKLILATNRDEYFERPTIPVSKWKGYNAYGGIDMKPGREGGSSFAISGKDGIIKVGVLLNIIGEPKPKNAEGRGKLVPDYVISSSKELNIEQYNKALCEKCTKYTAFNFLSIEFGLNGNPADIRMCTNVPPSLETYEQDKCYGFGYSLLHNPVIKVKHGQQLFQKILDKFIENLDKLSSSKDEKRQQLVAELNQMLKNREKYWPDPELSKRAPATWAEHLSSINVLVPNAGYGSRTHTVVLIDDNDCLYYYESTLNGTNPDEDEWKETYIEQCNFSQGS